MFDFWHVLSIFNERLTKKHKFLKQNKSVFGEMVLSLEMN